MLFNLAIDLAEHCTTDANVKTLSIAITEILSNSITIDAHTRESIKNLLVPDSVGNVLMSLGGVERVRTAAIAGHGIINKEVVVNNIPIDFIISHLSAAAEPGAVRIGTKSAPASSALTISQFANPDDSYGVMLVNDGDGIVENLLAIVVVVH